MHPAPTPAFASHSNFRGGCSGDTVHRRDTTGAWWVGEINVVVAATDDSANAVPQPHSSITGVRCDLFINDVPWHGNPVLTAPDGTGFTANAGRLEYPAEPTAVVKLCTTATVAGEHITKCATGQVTSLPGPVLVETVKAIVTLLGLDDLDPAICPRLQEVALVVNRLEPEVHVDPDSGDVYVLGDSSTTARRTTRTTTRSTR